MKDFGYKLVFLDEMIVLVKYQFRFPCQDENISGYSLEHMILFFAISNTLDIAENIKLQAGYTLRPLMFLLPL